MKLRFTGPLIFLFLACCGNKLTAQSIQVDGTVLDSLKKPISSATVMVMNRKDSAMLAFGFTDGKGKFLLKWKDQLEVRVQITAVGYGSFERMLNVDQEKVNLGEVVLSTTVYGLEGLSITETFVPIVIKKDTIEYRADAFSTTPDAVVEDLLKKLPGVEVEDDGTIKAQGKTVEKVLVDGQDFFGNDPKMASKNLPANIVDKVQVYDDKSDVARFTGVDDGNSEKTINLMLKEGKKKGTFGTVDGHYGTERRYKSKANLHRFNKKTRASLVANSNNVNEQTFSIQDYITMNGGMAGLMGGGNIEINGMPMGMSSQDGLANNTNIGLNVNHRPSKKLTLSGNYFVYRDLLNIDSKESAETLLENGGFNTSGYSLERLLNNAHRANTKLKFVADSLQELEWRVGFRAKGTNQESEAEQTTFVDQLALNKVSRNSQLHQNGQHLESKIRYKKRGKRNKALFSTNGTVLTDWENAEESVFNRTVNESSGTSISEIEQDQLSKLNHWQYKLDVNYVRKFNTKSFAIFSLGTSSFTKANQRDYFDMGEGADPIFNDALSNQFRQDYAYYTAASRLTQQIKRMRLGAGLAFQQSTLKGRNITSNSGIARSFQFVLPSLSLEWEVNGNTDLRISVDKSIREPSIQQLQPALVNNDPLRVYQGNPDLRPEQNHSLWINYTSTKSFNYRYLFFYANASWVTDKIVNASQLDTQFRQVFTPVNSDWQFRSTANLDYNILVRPLSVRLEAKANVTYVNQAYFVNGVEDRSRTLISMLELKFGNKNRKVIDATIGGWLSPRVTTYVLSDEADQQFLNSGISGDVAITKSNWTFQVQGRHRLYSGSSFEDDRNFTLIHAKLIKSIPKKKLSFQLTARDILNQNTGINRNTNANVVTEQVNVVLGRYFLLGLRYRISSFGK